MTTFAAAAKKHPHLLLSGRAKDIGREILTRARAAEPIITRPDWWMERLMGWSTANAQRKLQLFQFVDVFPTLDNDAEVARHLREYLLQDGVLPAPLATGLRLASVGGLRQRALAAATRAGVMCMARKFIAGRTPREAATAIRRLRGRRMGFTIDVLGEAVTSEAQAKRYAARYLHLLDELPLSLAYMPEIDQIDIGPGGTLMPRVNLSIKLSSLDPHFGPLNTVRSAEAVIERIRPILRQAKRSKAFINIDTEQYEYKDLTLTILRELLFDKEFRDFSDIGIVLQAYLSEALADLDRLVDMARSRGTPFAVRLVKGAYWDTETALASQHGWLVPVETEKHASDRNYDAMARTLLDNRDLIRPAFASHNIRSLALALAYAEEVGASRREYEVQMLYGMGDPLKTAVARMGYNLRVYAPFGQPVPGMSYLIRRLLENSANESFIKHGLHGSADRLLADSSITVKATPLPGPVAVDIKESSTMFDFEPMTDFSRDETRSKMAVQLGFVRQRFGQLYPLVVGGREIDTSQMIHSLNPSETSETVGRVCAAEDWHAANGVKAAKEAFLEWSHLSPAGRGSMLRRLADVMRRRRLELAAWIVFEVGKSWQEADGEVAEAIDFCVYYAQEGERLLGGERRRDFPGETNRYSYRPLGVVAVISPWNFPLAILTGMTTAALAAGNTVVMKPAQQSSVIAAKLMEMFEEADFPPGVVNYLPGSGRIIGPLLTKHPDVRMIAFTGSRDVGVDIYESAARRGHRMKHMKRVIAEMGGKNAIIIDSDADLDDAVAGVVASAFGYSGQKCSACSRAIVLSSVREEFERRLVETVESLLVGPTELPETIVGPVIDESAQRKILRYINPSPAHRQMERLISQRLYSADLGGLTDRGFFVPPTIFTGVEPMHQIAQDEIFGPVLVVMEAKDFSEAIEIANGTDYALTGGVFTRSPKHIEQAKDQFYVGSLYINRNITGALVDRQPFGGYAMSGVGSKAGGPDYLLQFMEPKTVVENTLRHGMVPEAL